MIYSFDAVNHNETKYHCGETWEKPESKNAKFFITNSNLADMIEFGFKDIVLKAQVSVKFERMTNGTSESRTAYIYMRKSVNDRGRNKMKFEFECPTQHACPPFTEAWDMFNKSRLHPNTNKVNLKIKSHYSIMLRNMEREYIDLKPDARSGRVPAHGYNLDKLESRVWGEDTDDRSGESEDILVEDDDDDKDDDDKTVEIIEIFDDSDDEAMKIVEISDDSSDSDDDLLHDSSGPAFLIKYRKMGILTN